MSLTIGIIGAGQLGRYLCEAAGPLALRTIVMTDDPKAPAAPFADAIIDGGLDNVEATRALIAACDVITFEIESVGLNVLACLADAVQTGAAAVHPDPGILLTLRNKATQKRWLLEHDLPTAPLRVFDDPAALTAALAAGELTFPCVQKTQVGGYDGRGVHILRSPDDAANRLPGPCLVEDFVAHEQELGILVARSAQGEIRCYEPVALRFDRAQHVLDAALMPAALSPNLRTAALDLGRHTVERLGGVGVFALELFLTPDNQLLINEISPRVHNSGHLTLDACHTSQFAQHLRAIAGLPLGDVAATQPAVMRNLLWRVDTGPAPAVPARVDGSAAQVYWYDKAEGRRWRKMGHLTALGDTIDAADADAEAACAAVRTLTNGACW